jgi:hypothetical protein
MNKQEQLKDLTWKYFKEQKWEEIWRVLFAIFIILGILGGIAQAGWACEKQPDNYPVCDAHTKGIPACSCKIPYEPVMPYWTMYTGMFIVGLWLIFGLIYWLRSNWKEAKERAERELGNKK